MGNVIPWSQIHPTITGEGPFVGVVIVDPGRQLCVSELISLDGDLLDQADRAAPELVAAAQRAAASVASAYRRQRQPPAPPSFRLIRGGLSRARARVGAPRPPSQPATPTR